MALRHRDSDRGYRLIRRLMAAGVGLFATALFGLWLTAPPERMPARFSAQDCSRVTLVDRDGGHAIRGAEGLALTPDGSIVLAAYDRLAPPEDARGGVYTVSVSALLGGGEIAVYRVDTPSQTPFRPHGLALSADGTRLATVNRTAPGEAAVEIGTLTPEGWLVERRLQGQRLCRANGLAFTGLGPDDLLISLDRADCEMSARDVWPGSQTGRLARFDGQDFQIVREGLSFPNGLASLYVAETRGDRILTPDGGAIALPGGPDNLWLAPDGRIVAALHPRVHLLWVYLRGWQTAAPSRIVLADPVNGKVEVLFDDPGGQLFAGATGAVLTDGTLIAGSVLDQGLLVCRRGGQ